METIGMGLTGLEDKHRETKPCEVRISGRNPQAGDAFARTRLPHRMLIFICLLHRATNNTQKFRQPGDTKASQDLKLWALGCLLPALSVHTEVRPKPSPLGGQISTKSLLGTLWA